MSFLRPKTVYPRQKIGLILIFFGIISFTGFLFLRISQQSEKNLLSFSEVPALEAQFSEDQFPSRIIIPSLKIDLPIFPAKAAETQWEISETGASYLLGSGIPGKESNVVIYAHNKRHLFGPIRWIKKEAEIKVTNKKGEEYLYKVVETKLVTPDKVTVLSATEDASLTLYTCTGFLDSQRWVVIAKLEPLSF